MSDFAEQKAGNLSPRTGTSVLHSVTVLPYCLNDVCRVSADEVIELQSWPFYWNVFRRWDSVVFTFIGTCQL